MKPVRYHPSAQEVFNQAVRYYTDIDRDLGRDCRGELKATRSLLQRVPKLFAEDETTGCREYIMRRFPYSFHYLELDDHIWIVAVAHHSRKPGYWRYRLRQR